MLTEASSTITLPDACSPWIFVNANARGYYRTAYSPELLLGIAPHVETDLTASERLMLDQTVEQINSCIALRESQTSAVTGWLAGR